MGVLLAYLHPHHVTASFHSSLNSLVAYDAAGPQLLDSWAAMKTETGGVALGRDIVAAQCVKDGHEWLFFVDSDMGFEPDSLERLMQVADPEKRPIVGGLCFAARELGADRKGGYRIRPKPTLFEWKTVEELEGDQHFVGRQHYPVDSLVRVAGTGAAFLLIHRSVLEKMQEKWGTWFERVRRADGFLVGEDLSFCMRAAALEVPVYVHTGVRTSHQKTIWLAEEDFWESFDAEPAAERVDVICRGPVETDMKRSLIASTGLAKIGKRSDARWVLLCDGKARFRPGWLDHAQQVAHLYSAKVVQCGRYLLVDKAFYQDHGPDERTLVEKAVADRCFQAALGSRVDSADEPVTS